MDRRKKIIIRTDLNEVEIFKNQLNCKILLVQQDKFSFFKLRKNSRLKEDRNEATVLPMSQKQKELLTDTMIMIFMQHFGYSKDFSTTNTYNLCIRFLQLL